MPGNVGPSLALRHVRACTNCVRAKAKCSSSTNTAGKCERCQRLKKECQPSPPMRRRRQGALGARNPGSKTERLEAKLDNLVTLLKSRGVQEANLVLEDHASSSEGHTPGVTATRSNGHSNSHSLNETPVVATAQSTNAVQTEGSIITPATTSFSEPIPMSLLQFIPPEFIPSEQEAETCLNRFRTQFIPNLPFVAIDPSMTAHQLRQHSSLLWVSIVTVTTTNCVLQTGLSHKVREIFGHAAYIDGRRDIDFLLAILVHVSWEREFSIDRQINASLVQLAIAIVYDLGLDKPTVCDAGLMLNHALKSHSKSPRMQRTPTLTERRAVLGCYLLSTVSAFSSKGDSLRWTPYFDEFLRVLEEQHESPFDMLLVQLVKLRLIANKAIFHQAINATDENSFITTHASSYVKSLELQLRHYKEHVPSEIANNKVLLLELSSTEFRIHSIVFSPFANFPAHTMRRFDCILACLEGIKKWGETFFAIPITEYYGLSALLHSKMRQSMLELCRCAMCDYPEWDLTLLQENVDVSAILEDVSKRFTEARNALVHDPTSQDDPGCFGQKASFLLNVKMNWDALTAPPSAHPNPSSSMDELVDFPFETSNFSYW